MRLQASDLLLSSKNFVTTSRPRSVSSCRALDTIPTLRQNHGARRLVRRFPPRGGRERRETPPWATPGPPTLSSGGNEMDTREIIDLLDRIAIVRRSEVRSEGAKHGLPAVQLDALRYLAACNRFSDTPASVAEFLDSTRGTISQTLIALERKRLIRKYTDPTDGRVVHCVPTHKAPRRRGAADLPLLRRGEQRVPRLSTAARPRPPGGTPLPPGRAARARSVVAVELVRIREARPSHEVQSKEEDKPALMVQYDHHYALLTQLRDRATSPSVDPVAPTSPTSAWRRRQAPRPLPRQGHPHRPRPAHRRLAQRPDQPGLLQLPAGRRVRGGVRRADDRGHGGGRRTVTIQRAVLHRVDAPEGSFLRGADGAWETRAASAPPRLAGGQGSRDHPRARGGRGGRAPPRHRRPRRGPPRRQAPARHRRPHRPRAVRPDHPPLAGFLVIRGTAGSGKTTVALHRIAWLAYEDPEVDSPHAVPGVQSRRCATTSANVLPALGVGRVQARTFPDWAAEPTPGALPHPAARLPDDTPEIVVRLKTHPATMIALEEQHIEVAGQPDAEQAIDDWASVLTQRDVLEPVFDELAPGAFTRPTSIAPQWCRDRHEELIAWLEGDAEEPACSTARTTPCCCAPGSSASARSATRASDRSRYRHIAIDEVQDFSPVEVRVLHRHASTTRRASPWRATRSSTSWRAPGFTSWTTFFAWLGVEGTAVETLRVAYRSSRQIVTFAQAARRAGRGRPPAHRARGPAGGAVPVHRPRRRRRVPRRHPQGARPEEAARQRRADHARRPLARPTTTA
jgi:DNA-binding MarR family transcriptional regulator